MSRARLTRVRAWSNVHARGNVMCHHTRTLMAEGQAEEAKQIRSNAPSAAIVMQLHCNCIYIFTKERTALASTQTSVRAARRRRLRAGGRRVVIAVLHQVCVRSSRSSSPARTSPNARALNAPLRPSYDSVACISEKCADASSLLCSCESRRLAALLETLEAGPSPNI